MNNNYIYYNNDNINYYNIDYAYRTRTGVYEERSRPIHEERSRTARQNITHNYTTINQNRQFNSSEELMENLERIMEDDRVREVIESTMSAVMNSPFPVNREAFIQTITTLLQPEPQPEPVVIVDDYLKPGDELIETCSVCMNDSSDIGTTSKLSCGHHFHTTCIKEWLHRSRTCPLCRAVCQK